MKYAGYLQPAEHLGRSPCGERGLKSQTRNALWTSWRSLPVRGAWIEIQFMHQADMMAMSLPVRGAWIEMGWYSGQEQINIVAPRAGSVD